MKAVAPPTTPLAGEVLERLSALLAAAVVKELRDRLAADRKARGAGR